jgi:hypothetical protein
LAITGSARIAKATGFIDASIKHALMLGADEYSLESKPSDLDSLESKPSDLDSLESKPSDLDSLKSKPSDLDSLKSKPSDFSGSHAPAWESSRDAPASPAGL